MRRLGALLLLVAAVGSASAMARQITPDPRLISRLDGKVRDAVIAIIDSAQRDGLPTEPLIQEALQGASMLATGGTRVTGGTIIQSVSSFAGYMRRARAALGPASSPTDVAAAAVALRSGVDVRQLERLRSARVGQHIATALEVLTYVRGLGVHPDTAANVIVTLVLASASDDQFLSLKDDVERDIAGGTPAALAMSARGNGLATQLKAAQQNDGGARGAALPSGLGSTFGADPAANGALGTQSTGSVAQPGGAPAGGAKPAPVGKPVKKP